eukprot:gene58296-biopygen79291
MAPTHMQQLPDGTLAHHLVTNKGRASVTQLSAALSKRDTTGLGSGYIVVKIRPGSRTREVVARISHPNAEDKPRYQHMQVMAGNYY